jgi:hypothetical protein
LTLLNIFFKEFPTESPEALALYFLFISEKKIFSNVKVEQGRAKHDWTKRTKRYYGITWKSQSNSHIAFSDISSVIPDDFFVLSKLTVSIIIGYFIGDIVNGSKVLLEIILNPYYNADCKF